MRQLLALLSPAGRALAAGSHWSSSDAAAAAGTGAGAGAGTGASAGAGTGAGAGAGPGPGAAAHSELALYAMMALVNLTYCCAELQHRVRECGGLPLLLQQLSSPLHAVR